MIIATTAGMLIIRRALTPLNRVAAAAGAVANLPLDRGEVELPVRIPAPDANPHTEVGRLGLAINRMLEHISAALSTRQASESRVRQFVADASHELRTPLAAIRGYTELAQRKRDQMPDDVAHAMGRVESEAVRMTRLVEDLLLLARLDSGRPLEREPVDLARLSADVVSDAHAAGPEHCWNLDVPPDPLYVVGDDARLHQVVANLLANARTHTPPGTLVTLSLDTEPGAAVLRVVDNGQVSPLNCSQKCSSASPVVTPPGPVKAARPGWGWLSPQRSSRRTAAASACVVCPVAPSSPYGCPAQRGLSHRSVPGHRRRAAWRGDRRRPPYRTCRSGSSARRHRGGVSVEPRCQRLGKRILFCCRTGRFDELDGMAVRIERPVQCDHRGQDSGGAVGDGTVGADLRCQSVEHPGAAGGIRGGRGSGALRRGAQDQRAVGGVAGRRNPGCHSGSGIDVPFQQPDALLVLALVCAAYATQRALSRQGMGVVAAAGRSRHRRRVPGQDDAGLPGAAGSGADVRGGRRPALAHRVRRLAGAAAALVLSGGWYLILVSVWPAAARPYIGGSQHNSIIELALGYNGLGRLTGDETGGLGNLNFDVGWARLFGAEMGPHVAWLLPAAVVALLAGLWITRGRPRTDLTRAALLLWGGWLTVTAVVFSYANGILHPYYTVALAPAVAATVSIGTRLLWQRRADLRAATALSGMMAITAGLSNVLLQHYSQWLPWLRLTILIGGIAAALLLVVVARLPRAVEVTVAALAIVVALAGPVGVSVATASSPRSGAIPSVGPSDRAGGGMPGLFGAPDRVPMWSPHCVPARPNTPGPLRLSDRAMQPDTNSTRVSRCWLSADSTAPIRRRRSNSSRTTSPTAVFIGSSTARCPVPALSHTPEAMPQNASGRG